MFFHDTLALLERRGIRYIVVGGVAVVLHGIVRATADLDLFVDLEPGNIKALLAILKEAGFQPRIPVDLEDFADIEKRRKWALEKGMKVFSVFHPQRLGELIDIFLDEPIPFAQAYARRERIPVGQASISVVSIGDLMALKRSAGRPQDLEDLRALEHLKKKGAA